MFSEVKPMTLMSSLKSLRYRLWDEDAGKMIGFSCLRVYGQIPEPTGTVEK